MRAGLLNETISIYEKTLVVNEYGEETEEWVKTYTTKARIVHDGGSRVIENDEVFYSHSKTFQVRYYVPVGEYNRIEWKDNFYRILNIEYDKKLNNITIKGELIDD